MSVSQAPTVTTLFVDTATFSDLESHFYGGCSALTYFARAIQKCNWFSFMPTPLRRSTGQALFGSEFSVNVNRSGDYVIKAWLQCQVPIVYLRDQGGLNQLRTDARISWCNRFMHNLVEECTITFNELEIHKVKSFWFDCLREFDIKGSKTVGYDNMIGQVPALTNQVAPQVAPGNVAAQQLGVGGTYMLPLPITFFLDTGTSIPASALPFNDIRLNFRLRPLSELLFVYPGTAAGGGNVQATINDVFVAGTNATVPELANVEVWAIYGVVHNAERVKMGKCPRDIVLAQNQELQDQPFVPANVGVTISYDVRLSHGVKAFFFAAKNTTFAAEHSNYSTISAFAQGGGVGATGFDPIQSSGLLYENTYRTNMVAQAYTLTLPWYFARSMPDSALGTGMHAYFYAFKWYSFDPTGQTNFSKLQNISQAYVPSAAAVNAAAGNVAGVAITYPDVAGNLVASPQLFTHKFNAVNVNIGRVAGGSFGLPIL